MTLKVMRTLASAAAGIALAATLGACSGGTPGTAAVIDGRSFSEDAVSTASEQLSTMMGQPYGPGDIVGLLHNVVVFDEVSKSLGINVTDDQVDQLLQTQAGQIQQLDEPMAPVTRDLWRMIVQQNLLSSGAVDMDKANAAYLEVTENMDAKANPRYGTFDVQGQLSKQVLGDVQPLGQLGNETQGTGNVGGEAPVQ